MGFVPFTLETLYIVLPYSVILALIGLIESLLTLNLVDELTETTGKPNKESVGQGIANTVTGFFGGWSNSSIRIYFEDYSLETTNSPDNLTKGTASGTCSALTFGNFNDLIIGEWGSLDISVDPYTNAAKGGTRIIGLYDVDVAVRHAESFAAIQDNNA